MQDLTTEELKALSDRLHRAGYSSAHYVGERLCDGSLCLSGTLGAVDLADPATLGAVVGWLEDRIGEQLCLVPSSTVAGEPVYRVVGATTGNAYSLGFDRASALVLCAEYLADGRVEAIKEQARQDEALFRPTK